jgi:type I restriction enzyme S subunit
MKVTKNIPALRFPGFEGEWRKKELQEICEVKGGKRIPKGYSLQDEANGYPFITVSDMKNGTILLEDIKYVPDEVVSKIRNYRITTKDIFISVAGTLGLVGIIPSELENANLTENANKLTSITCSQSYLYHYLNTKKLTKLIEGVSTNNAQPKLAIYAIKKFEVSLPSLPEQQKIASFLSSVDQRIQLLTQKKEKLEQYKKGVMQRIFSQELRFKDEHGQDYPEWEEKRLGDISVIFKGKGISKDDITSDGQIECIRYGELYTVYRETITKVYSKTNCPSKDLILSKKHDVIIPASGETQIDIARASCVMRDGIALGGDLNIIRTDIDGVYLTYYINGALKYEIAKAAQGISVIHLYGSQLKELRIKLPNEAEQQKIASFLSSIDDKINHINSQMDLTRKWKHGLLQKMFV